MRPTIYIIFLFFVIIPSTLFGQVIRGLVVDQSGDVIPNVSVFIRETAQGIITDDQGEFQVSLKAGNYTFEFSSIGFEWKSVPVKVKQVSVSFQVEMETKVYAIHEVVVSAKSEDPAYAIMRKVIATAPFYLNQIKRYESEVYLKGTMKVSKIPKILKIKAGNQSVKELVDRLFLLESHNKVVFTAPNKYKQHVIAVSSNIPSEIDMADAMDVITANIYDTGAMGRISPLSPNAFAYYNFSWEGITMDRGYMVNKIRVLPKKKNPKLVSGWLYVIENSWNIQSADLSATEFGVTVRFAANYNEIKPFAFLPTTYDIDIDVDVMGIKAAGKYYSSIQYKNVDLNLQESIVRKEENNEIRPVANPIQLTKKQVKAQKTLDRLYEKEDLSNRDAYKIAKLLEELTESEEKRQERESLDLLASDRKVQITVDSLANQRDSLYWNDIRNLPLREEEIESYQIKDSLMLFRESGEREVVLSSSRSDWGKWLLGGYSSWGKGSYVKYGGLLKSVPEYNFVDGFWIGQELVFGKKLAPGRSLSCSPAAFYAMGRKKVNWQLGFHLKYAPMQGGELKLAGGNKTADFDRDGELRLSNTFSSLFFGYNPIKFYQKKFFEISNMIDITNGLRLRASIIHENRNALRNHTSFTVFKRTPEPNLPGNTLKPMPDNKATKYDLHVEYTPRYYYYMEGKRKRYAYSRYPAFSLGIVKGIVTPKGSNYKRMEASIKQDISLNAFDHINYYLNTGFYNHASHIAFPDYKHFQTSELFVTGHSVENSFSALDNYIMSTNKRWVQMYINYSSAYLLVKHLPFLQNYLFNESLHIRSLWIPGKRYSEAGYSLGVKNVVRLGVFIGFRNEGYDGVGVTISFPIFREMGVR